MNIQRKNSAHHFRMQSEREQTLVNEKWMAKRFSKRYRNKGIHLNYLQALSYVELPVRA